MQVYVLAPAPALPPAFDGRVQVLERLPDLCRAPWNR
jgi:hypothetical protein